MKRFFNRNHLILLVIFLLSFGLRIFGINWDQGTHLHPDERYLTMVTNDIRLPVNIVNYFDSQTSSLNPYNYSQYPSFVYGTLPLFLTKFCSVILGYDNYDHIQFVGRTLSAIFDSFNIFLIYLLAKKILSRNSNLIFFPAIFYGLSVLPIQLSHFYAVDTFLNFFLLFTFTLMAYDLFALAAFTFGLAFACKISAVYFVPVIFLFLLLKLINTRNIFYVLRIAFSGLLIGLITVRIFQPYMFNGFFGLDQRFISDIKNWQRLSLAAGNYPPGVQWLSKTPLIFPLQNIILFGIGLPISLLFFTSIIRTISFPKFNLKSIILFWIGFLFIYQGIQFAHTLRYFLPIYPFIILIATTYPHKFTKLVLFIQLIICLGFLCIYTVPHSRVQASYWIYQNLPNGSKITNEYWDDPLPLYLPQHDPNTFNGLMISPYDPDSPEKMSILISQINSAQYVIMSSNRLWGSIPLVPNKYPLTSKFYEDLFSEKLNYKKIIEINSYPGFKLPINGCYFLGPTNFPGINNNWFSFDKNCTYPGIYIRDDIAEEAFTVYDHPKVLIFQNKN